MVETIDKVELSVEVDKVTPGEWGKWLNLFQDANIYQTWSYGMVRWGQQNLSHLVLKRAGQVVAMAQLRIVRPGNLKFGVAYLRWGPLCHFKQSELDPEVVRTIALALQNEYVRKRGLFLRILPNAFIDTARASIFRSAFSQFHNEPFGQADSYRTLVLDLEPPLEALRKALDQKWRNQLNRAEKNGLKIIEGTGLEEFGIMIGLYHEMWGRKQFHKTSDIEEFGRIQASLALEQKMRVLICEDDGTPVAGAIGTAMGDSGIYLFGATNDRGLSCKGSYLLQWRMIQWLKASGMRYYNLGGINPERNPGVYHFKKGLSGKDVLFMNPMISCNSLLSAGFARLGGLAKGRFRKPLNDLLRRT